MLNKFKTALPARLNYSEFVRLFAFEMASDAKLSWKECNIVKLIVDELFINAVRYWSNEKSNVYIEWSFKPWEVSYCIEDEWKWSNKIKAKDLNKIINKEIKNDDPGKLHWRWLAQITTTMSTKFSVSDSRHWWLKIKFTKKAWIGKEKHVKKKVNIHQDLKNETKIKKIFKLSWEIAPGSIEEFSNPIHDYVEKIYTPVTIIFDCNDLKYINTVFIWNLLQWHSKINFHWWKIIIRDANEDVHDILDLIWLKKLILFENLNESV